jgi:soluble lytic murein transglycosylase-like protein
MSARLMVVCFVAALCVWGSASTAQAQIYMLRQEDGSIILSDKPLGPGARTFAVERAAENVRATRPVSGSSVVYSSRYDSLIEEHASKQNLRADLVRAVIQVESGFNPHALSNKGAMGLMQLMPQTAREYNVQNPYDPASNIEAGIKKLKSLIDRLPLELALAAYNAGEGAVAKFNGIPPYRETRSYVTRIIALASGR